MAGWIAASRRADLAVCAHVPVAGTGIVFSALSLGGADRGGSPAGIEPCGLARRDRMENITPDLALLLLTAASIGCIHTLLGPDHYLPFVALSKSHKWSTRRTIAITSACGAGHVLSSVVIGIVGIAAGAAIERVVHFESWRGDIAAWLLLGFGMTYLAWGVKRALRGEAHFHSHLHADGTRHSHHHDHRLAPHVHPHAVGSSAECSFTTVESRSVGAIATPWALFIIFVFGPCEPLIPVLMYPAAHASWFAIAAVCLAFSLATIGTMLAVVLLVRRGLDAIGAHAHGMERWSHAMAGAALSACAAAILFLGL
jgi:sulfite exporter TauE/SafE